MNRPTCIAILLASTVVQATAAPRFAVIRVKDIYADLPSTAATQERVKHQREEIMKDPRAENLRRIIAELQDLQTKLSDKNNPLPEETSRKLARTYEIKRQEAQTLQKDFEGYRAEQEKQINRQMVADMRTSLDKITETSRKIAKEQGYDLVLDSSGGTNTGVPFILCSKNSPDLTDDVKAALKDSAAAPAAPAPVLAKPATSAKH